MDTRTNPVDNFRLKVFHKASICRNFEDVVFSKIEQKKINFPVYLSAGQEFIPASIAQYVNDKNIKPDIFIQHRGHSTYLAFGGEIEGLISVEDIFKEITGKFGGDKEELEKEFYQQQDGSILTDGNSKIRDLNNYLGWNILEDGPKTINGLITEYLDQIPQANLCIEIEGYRFEVLELDENLISKIKITKI